MRASGFSFKLFFLLVIVFQFIQIIYFQRSIFLEIYDTTYWQDRLEHSQWHLPLSKRIVGDDGLFSYVGINLIKGADPSIFINPETPPLGKYLIGLSILVFRNPAYYALLLGIGTLILFYHFSKKILKNQENALFLTAILSLDPLFFSQLNKAWVDLPQLFFLLANLLIFHKITDSKIKRKLFLSLMAGLFLGFFTQTKPAILFPVLFILEAGFLFWNKLWKETFIFNFGIAAGVLLVYIPYFSHGHNLIDFLKLQKYIIAFYTKSQLVVHKEAIWQTLFLGKFPDITSRIPTNITEWWILWPIVTFIGILVSVMFIFRRNSSLFQKGLALFVLISLIIFTLIPSYPRYLLILLPFLYLFSVYITDKFLKKELKLVMLSIILIYGLIHSTYYLLPKPDSLLKNFYYNFSNQYFHDIYQENLVGEDRVSLSRQDFRSIAQGALEDATIKAIEITEKKRNISSNKGEIEISVLYRTNDLGSFREDKKVYLVKENGEWKVKWNWSLLFKDFMPSLTIETDINFAKRGSIFDEFGKILAEDSGGYLILVNPEQIDTKKEEKMLMLLGEISHSKPVHLQNAYLENALPGKSIPIATNFILLSDELKEELASYPGLSMTDHPVRVYKGFINPTTIRNLFYEECCTRIYSVYNYHGVSGLEKDYDSVLWGESGGSIVIKTKDGDLVRTIIRKGKKDGEDIFL